MENLECIKELSGGTNNRIYSVNDKYFLKFKDFSFIIGENIYFKIVLGDEKWFIAMKKLY